MQTQTWRPNVGIAELGEDNLFHVGPDGLEPIVMVVCTENFIRVDDAPESPKLAE